MLGAKSVDHVLMFNEGCQNAQCIAGQGQRIFIVVIDRVPFFIIWFCLTIALMFPGLDQTYTDETGEQ